MPGMGTIQGFWASSQANAICAGVALFPFSHRAQQIDHRLIRLPGLRREARDDVAEVGAVERRALVDFPREESLAKRAEGHEPDAELLEGRQHFRFGLPKPQRVFALERGDRLDGVGAADRLHAGFREPEVLDLAFVNQILHRPGDVFDRHVRVHAVLIEEVDRLDLQTLQRGLGNLFDVRRPAIEAARSIGFEREPELGRDDHLVTEGAERFADELFIDERAVGFGGVEERDAAFDGRPKQRDSFLPVNSGAVAKAQSHAAEPKRRDFEVAVAECSLPHVALR